MKFKFSTDKNAMDIVVETPAKRRRQSGHSHTAHLQQQLLCSTSTDTMSAQKHRHGLGETPFNGHSHGTTVPAAGNEHDFNEMLEEAHPCCQKEAESKET